MVFAVNHNYSDMHPNTSSHFPYSWANMVHTKLITNISGYIVQYCLFKSNFTAANIDDIN